MRVRGTGCRAAAIVVLLACAALASPALASAAPSCPATISVSTPYDTSISIPLGCTDALTISYSVGTAPTHGTLGSFNNGAVLYIPSVTFANHSDSFSVDATDPLTPSNSPTVVKVSVAVGSPAPPRCTAIQASTAYATPVTVTLDCAGTGLAFTANVGPKHGSLGSVGGTVTYTPNPYFAGQDGFSYVVTDIAGQTTIESVLVTVAPPPKPACPAVSAQTAYVTTTTVALTCSGVLLTYVEVGSSGPAHGTVSPAGEASFTYTPDAGFAGEDHFQVLVTDFDDQSALATVTIAVAPPAPPACPGDAATTPYETAVAVSFSCTGTGLSYAYMAGSGPADGTLNSIATNHVTYTPAAGFFGRDSFAVLATDAVGQTATDTVTMTVGTPAAPACTGDTASAAYATTTTLTFSCAGAGLSYSAAAGHAPAHGTVGSFTGGQATYTPAAGFAGEDSFEILATDVIGRIATDTVTVTVAPPPKPVCSGDGGSTAFRTPVTITLSCTGTALSYAVLSGHGPSDGTLGSFTDTQVTYIPAAGFVGQDSFEVEAIDAVGQTATDSVTVNVAEPAAPRCSGDTASTAYETAVTVGFSCAGTGLSYSALAGHGPADGTLGAISGDQVTYTPAAGFSGQDSFEVLATDGVGQTATDTVTVMVGAPPSSTTVSTSTTITPPTSSTSTAPTSTTVTATTTPAIAAGPPTVQISRPAAGAVYRLGQAVTAQFSCSDAAQGPGLSSCTGTVADGAAIDTATRGSHSFTVAAVSRDGQRSARTATYAVLAPSNRFAVLRAHTRSGGTVSFELALPGPGVAVMRETIWTGRHAASGSALPPALSRYVVARRRLVARRAGTFTASVRPGASGRALVASHASTVVIALWVSYTPSGGTARAIRVGRLRVTR